MNRELNIFGDRSVGRAALGRATGYLLKCPPLTPLKSASGKLPLLVSLWTTTNRRRGHGGSSCRCDYSATPFQLTLADAQFQRAPEPSCVA